MVELKLRHLDEVQQAFDLVRGGGSAQGAQLVADYCIDASGEHHTTTQCSAVQYSIVQCSAVQCSVVWCSAVQCSAVWFGAVQCSAV